jgi:hypothetical protein
MTIQYRRIVCCAIFFFGAFSGTLWAAGQDNSVSPMPGKTGAAEAELIRQANLVSKKALDLRLKARESQPPLFRK